MSKFVKPFRTGDVVCHVGKDKFWNGEHIIREVGQIHWPYDYSTTRGAWIDHRDLTLVRECDKKSMKVLQD